MAYDYNIFFEHDDRLLCDFKDGKGQREVLLVSFKFYTKVTRLQNGKIEEKLALQYSDCFGNKYDAYVLRDALIKVCETKSPAPVPYMPYFKPIM